LHRPSNNYSHSLWSFNHFSGHIPYLLTHFSFLIQGTVRACNITRRSDTALQLLVIFLQKYIQQIPENTIEIGLLCENFLLSAYYLINDRFCQNLILCCYLICY